MASGGREGHGAPKKPRDKGRPRGNHSAAVLRGLTVKQASTLNCSGPPKSPARDGKDSTRGRRAGAGRQDSARPTINHKLSRAVPSPNQLASCVIGNKLVTDGEHTTDAGRSIPPAGGGGGQS